MTTPQWIDLTPTQQLISLATTRQAVATILQSWIHSPEVASALQDALLAIDHETHTTKKDTNHVA